MFSFCSGYLQFSIFLHTGYSVNKYIPSKISRSVAVNKLLGNIKVNPKDFYRYTNSQRKDNQGIPPLKRRNGSGLGESKTEQAEEFNGQFTDVFSKTSESEVPLLEKSASPMSDIHVSNDGVIKCLNT